MVAPENLICAVGEEWIVPHYWETIGPSGRRSYPSVHTKAEALLVVVKSATEEKPRERMGLKEDPVL